MGIGSRSLGEFPSSSCGLCDSLRARRAIDLGDDDCPALKTFRPASKFVENGRCRVHGGVSTGPKTPEGKARVVAAMVEDGASGWSGDAPRVGASPRGAGAATHGLQRLCASALERKRGGSVAAVSRSIGRGSSPCSGARGETACGRRKPRRCSMPMSRGKQTATVSRLCRSFATCARGRSPAGLAARGSRRLTPSRKSARTLTPHALRSDRLGGRPDHSHRQVAAESLPGARPPRGNNDGESPGRQFAGKRLAVEAAMATINTKTR